MASMVSLIANPGIYDKKLVFVTGYYKMGMEASGLFLTKDHAEIEDYSNAIWVSVNKESTLSVKNARDEFWKNWIEGLVDKNSANNRYVQIVGIFHAGPSGHMGAYQGKITETPGFSVKSK